MQLFAIALPKFTLLVLLIKKPMLLGITLIASTVTALVVDFNPAKDALLYLFLADLVSGLLSSWFTWKAKVDKKDRHFFGSGDEGFSSDKLKKLGVKVIVYSAAPYYMVKFQECFMFKNVKYDKISDAEFTLSAVLILIFCANEIFSIFFENLPKCGLDVPNKIKKFIKWFYTSQKEITDDK